MTAPRPRQRRQKPLAQQGPSRHDVYAAFWIKFDQSFDFGLGGKVPGLCGGTCNNGGNKPNGRDGFEAIMMWQAGGKVISYVYHPDQPGTYGDTFPWNVGGQRYFQPGKWHHIEQRVVINTPGQHDGMIQGWFDGKLALEVKNLRFRDVSSFAVDTFFFQTHFGGTGSEWQPKTDQFTYFDNFVVSTQRIGM